MQFFKREKQQRNNTQFEGKTAETMHMRKKQHGNKTQYKQKKAEMQNPIREDGRNKKPFIGEKKKRPITHCQTKMAERQNPV